MVHINDLSLEQKIGQLLVIGFTGTELTEEHKEHIKKYHLGNIIYFARNLETKEQMIKLSSSIQEVVLGANGIPAFITVDQEGGMVTRIFDGGTFFPGNMAFGAVGDPHNTYLEGQYMAKELLNFGINFNLAPVLDVNNNSKNPVIGVRSYGDNPNKVADFACEYIRGLQSENVIATGKHFPGHGDTSVDSHFALPTIKHTMDRLEAVELVPFRRAIESGIEAIMTSHILFENLTDDHLPATLSPEILTGLLRGKLGFNGLIMTDSMEMKAILNGVGLAKGAVKAVLAGADLLCVSHTMEEQTEVYEAIYKAVKAGVISEERINESVERILATKEKYKIKDYKKYMNVLSTEEMEKHHAFAKEISRKSVTLIKGEQSHVATSEEKTLVISTPPVALNAADAKLQEDRTFAKILADKIGGDYKIIPLNMEEEDIASIVEEVKKYDKVIIGTYNATVFTSQGTLVNEIYKKNNNVVAVALRNPYDIEMYKEVPVFLTAYEYSQLSIESLVHAMTTPYTCTGESPVTIEYENRH